VQTWEYLELRVLWDKRIWTCSDGLDGRLPNVVARPAQEGGRSAWEMTSIAPVLDDLGTQGWELVTAYSDGQRLVLKRPKWVSASVPSSEGSVPAAPTLEEVTQPELGAQSGAQGTPSPETDGTTAAVAGGATSSDWDHYMEKARRLLEETTQWQPPNPPKKSDGSGGKRQ
jgi:hypothetical protein